MCTSEHHTFLDKQNTKNLELASSSLVLRVSAQEYTLCINARLAAVDACRVTGRLLIGTVTHLVSACPLPATMCHTPALTQPPVVLTVPACKSRCVVIAGPQDVSVYELHVRDFSASDVSCPAQLRGKYAAFSPTATGSMTAGQQHLESLADAGLTHVHLLPSYDFGSVPERPENQLEPAIDLSSCAPGVALSLIMQTAQQGQVHSAGIRSR